MQIGIIDGRSDQELAAATIRAPRIKCQRRAHSAKPASSIEIKRTATQIGGIISCLCRAECSRGGNTQSTIIACRHFGNGHIGIGGHGNIARRTHCAAIRHLHDGIAHFHNQITASAHNTAKQTRCGTARPEPHILGHGHIPKRGRRDVNSIGHRIGLIPIKDIAQRPKLDIQPACPGEKFGHASRGDVMPLRAKAIAYIPIDRGDRHIAMFGNQFAKNDIFLCMNCDIAGLGNRLVSVHVKEIGGDKIDIRGNHITGQGEIPGCADGACHVGCRQENPRRSIERCISLRRHSNRQQIGITHNDILRAGNGHRSDKIILRRILAIAQVKSDIARFRLASGGKRACP